MDESMLTLCTHQIVIELDHQIDATGPIKDSMGSWIERICKQAVEPTVRKFENFFSDLQNIINK